MKKKIIVAALVLVILVASGIYMAWRHTTLLEQIPEEIWDGEVSMTYYVGGPWGDTGYVGLGAAIDITAEELRETFSDAVILHVIDPDEYTIPEFLIEIITDERKCNMSIEVSGYVRYMEYALGAPVDGDGTQSEKEEAFVKGGWYWDGGKMFLLLVEKYVKLSSLLPESSWGTVEWAHYDAEEKDIDAQGECDPEELYDLLQVAVTAPTTDEMAEGYDYYTLSVSNGEWEPHINYQITINELGMVNIQVQKEGGIGSNDYFEIDPGVFQGLDEMFLASTEE